jgi:cholesterol oxidase
MSAPFDVIVVGSGFGGAIAAARLAASGARVLVLERGRRWSPAQYPRTATDAWIYSNARPHRRNGWIDIRSFRRMVVLQGAGVGGGSLCFSAVVMEPPATAFAAGWPSEVTAAELSPYFRQVEGMLGVGPIPQGQRTRRGQLLERAATSLGYESRLRRVPLAINFDAAWHYAQDDPLALTHSQSFVNEHGQRQGTCVHLGNCDIGCEALAKNSLDFNYIPMAERHGAEVRPLHVVRRVQVAGRGYRVFFDRIDSGRLVAGSEWADHVVLASGSIGTTDLLLRCRDQYGTLPKLSGRLGHGWSPNANFMTTARFRDGAVVMQGVGPTISEGLDFLDGGIGGERFVIQDDGFPNLLHLALSALPAGLATRLGWRPTRTLDEPNATRNLMMWLGAGVDAGDGVLSLKRRRSRSPALTLHWQVTQSRRLADTIIDMHRRLSSALGGRMLPPLLWPVFRGMVSVHPLGGCAMASTADQGVVDHAGRVHGYERLFVADGSVIPRPIGCNPSMTIGALSERFSALLIAGERPRQP